MSRRLDKARSFGDLDYRIVLGEEGCRCREKIWVERLQAFKLKLRAIKDQKEVLVTWVFLSMGRLVYLVMVAGGSGQLICHYVCGALRPPVLSGLVDLWNQPIGDFILAI